MSTSENIIKTLQDLQDLQEKNTNEILQYQDYLLDVKLINNYLSSQEAQNLYDIIYALSWNITKRNTKVYGDTKTLDGFKEYKYKDWSEIPELITLKDKLEKDEKDSIYNVCIIQFYPNGKIGIGAHRDKEVPVNSKITGISLGSTRTLRLSRGNKKYDLSLENGSKYNIEGVTNQFWSHEILESNEVDEPRISLTFRNYQK